MVVLPGGYPGVDRLLESEETLALLREMDARGRWLAAICAGPRVLDKAGVLENKRYTAYPGQEDKIAAGTYCEDIVVQDGNVITSRGVCHGVRLCLCPGGRFGRGQPGGQEPDGLFQCV